MPRETKREKRLRAQERRALEQQNTINRKRTRRWVLRGAAAVLGTGLALAAAAQCEPFNTSLGVKSPFVKADLIAGEVNRLGITKSPTEINLWNTKGFSIDRKPMSDAEVDREALSRMNATLVPMSESENEIFSKRAHYILSRTASGILVLDTRPNENPNGDQIVMTTGHRVRGGNFMFTIRGDSVEMVRRSTARDIALSFAHESEHLMQEEAVDAPNAELPSSVRSRAQILSHLDRDHNIENEADAYGVQSLAYIINAGLTGIRNLNSEDEYLAINFIRNGSNSKNPGWRQFLRDYFPSIGLTVSN